MKNVVLFTTLSLLLAIPLQAQDVQNHTHSEHLETLLSEYLVMKNALINDDFEKARSSLQKFADEVTTSSEMNHHPEHKQKHVAHHRAMISAVSSASNAENIAQLRNAFDEISVELITAIENQGYGDNLYIQFCPMADNGNGAKWLSETDEIENPYFGSTMLKCGSVIETIN